MANLFDEFIGKRLERVHYLPEGLGDYKTITFSFANGRCITFEVGLQYPTMRVTQGNWELIKADPEESEELKRIREFEGGRPAEY